jgi:uncharacterized protein YceH (UPF0502 family)
MDMTAAEGRVLGCLIEAQVANPDVYAITLDELRFSCNQTSGRHPVMLLDDRVVEDTLLGLRSRGLARFVVAGRNAGPTSYRHRADERWRLGPNELVVLSILLLRGPQTVDEVWGLVGEPGAVGSRTEVEAALDTLAGRTPRPLATRLPPTSGRDATWVEVLTGWPQVDDGVPAPVPTPVASRAAGTGRPGPTLAEVVDRLTNIERRLAGIEAALLALRNANPPPQPQQQSQQSPSRIHR